MKESAHHVHDSEFEEHLQFRNYVRDVILGANDGLVSVFALVVGVAAGGLERADVLLAGLAGLIAGAISMGIGEYISTKSQEQVYDAEMELERKHIKTNLPHEKEELYEFYRDKGFEGEILDTIVETIASDPEVLLKEMMMAEFGVLEETRRSPITATIIIGIAFALGALLPIFPLFFMSNSASTGTMVLFSTLFSITGLFAVGAAKAIAIKANYWQAGTENLLLGLAGAFVTYLIGSVIGTSI